MDTRRAMKAGAVVRLVRACGFGLVVALGGVLVGLGVLRATNVFRMIPEDEAQIWVKSGCTAAEAAVRAALHATLERPVFLIPLDQDSEMAQNACRSALSSLEHRGYRWLRLFPEPWLCQRFADEASEYFGEPIPVPRFYADGQFVCDGLCDGVFELIGRPELQKFVFFARPGAAGETQEAL